MRPDGNLGLDASGSFTRGASIASQIIDSRLRREQQELNYNIQDRQVALQEQEAQQKLQQQKAWQQLTQEAYNKPDIVLPQMYAQNPEAASKVSEAIQQRYSQQYNTLSLLTKDTKAENKQATYELLRPELERQFPELEFGDKASAELMNSLKARASTIKAKMKTNLEFRDTAQGIMGFDPQTGETTSTGVESGDAEKRRLEVLKLRKEIASDGINPEERFKNTTALRNDYLGTTKTFQNTREAYERVNSAAQDPSPAGDLALIFGYMKILDPGSTVREGEFANAQNAGSAFEKVGSLYNRVVSGERLTEKQRADFINQSKNLYKQAEKSHRKTVDQYTKIAERNKLDPRDVVVDFETTVPDFPLNNMPEAGVVEDGYQFLGGDPSKPESWRKQ